MVTAIMLIFGKVRMSDDEPASKQTKQLQISVNTLPRFVLGSRFKDKVGVEDLLKRTKLAAIIGI